MARHKKTDQDLASEPVQAVRQSVKEGSRTTKRLAAGAQPSGSKALPRPAFDQTLYTRLTGCSSRAIADWEAGNAPSTTTLRRVKEIDRFCSRLAEVVAADAIPAWLETPNPAFEGLRPVEVVERGEIDRLWDMIYYLESGVSG